jgi:virginiamycin B lyase
MRLPASRRSARSLVAVAFATLGGLTAAAPASAIQRTTELPIPLFAPFQSVSPNTTDIAAGPDGNLWFAQTDHNALEKITPGGAATEYSTGFTPAVSPTHLTAGADGNLWFTMAGAARIGRMATDGDPLKTVSFTAGIDASAQPGVITVGPDGNVWFAEPNVSQLARITPAGTVTEYWVGAAVTQIVAGDDGALWLATSSGISRFDLAGGGSTPIATLSGITGLTWGPDGNLWATTAASVVRVTPFGSTTFFTDGIDPAASINDIATGSDGNLWFSDYASKAIGRLTPAGALTTFKTLNGAGNRPFGLVAGPSGTLWYWTSGGQVAGKVQTIVEPTVDATTERNVTTTTAALTVRINPQGAETTVKIDWGPDAQYGTSTSSVTVPAGIVPVPVSIPIDGLAPGTSYHFRVRATNAQGDAVTSDDTFATAYAPNPETPALPTPVATPSGGTSPIKPGQLGGVDGKTGVVTLTPVVKLGATKAAVSAKGIVKLPLACSGTACAGTIVMTARVKGPKSKLVPIGTKPVALAAGASTKLGVRVSSAGRRAIKAAGKKGLGVVATITLGSVTTKVKVVLRG